MLSLARRRAARATLYFGAASLIALVGCAKRGAPATELDSDGRAAAPSAVPLAHSAPLLPSVPPPGFADAVRASDFTRALSAIDALDSATRDKPLIRFARARVLFELGRAKEALPLLADLERELPALSSSVQMLRAECQLRVGPYADAARYFQASSTPEHWLKAATAFDQAGEPEKAQLAVDGALAKIKPDSNRELIANLRALRARLLEKRGERARLVAELAWLAKQAPDQAVAREADQKLGELAPERALTANERYERALVLAEAGRVADVERALALISTARGPKPLEAKLGRVRGWALYNARTDDHQAAELLERSSRAPGPDQARDLYYAGRALSRTKETERAIALLGQVSAKFKKSEFAEQAAYLAARLEYSSGDFENAELKYLEYEKRFGKSADHFAEVKYERSVAQLASGKHARAIESFEALIRTAPDDRTLARYRALKAIALSSDGKKDEATKLFRSLVGERPLSLPALFSATRLKLQSEAPSLMPAGAAPAGSWNSPLPENVALLHEIGLDAEAERALVGLEGALRQKYKDQSDRELCELYGQLGVAERRYKIGQNAVSRDALDRPPEVGSRWAWDCVFPAPYLALVRAAEQRHTLPRYLLLAVMRQESAFAPAVVSPARAVGLMQLMPETARRMSAELGKTYDERSLVVPSANLELGAAYLAKLLAMFGGSEALAVAAYNAGPQAVGRWLTGSEKLPLDVFVARIPFAETRNYVYRVLENRARYLYLHEGLEHVVLPALEIPNGIQVPADAY